MQKFLEATGESRDAAIANALRQLGLDRDDVSVEVLDNGQKAFRHWCDPAARPRDL